MQIPNKNISFLNILVSILKNKKKSKIQVYDKDRSSIPQKWSFRLPLYAQSRINFKSYYDGLEIVMVSLSGV